MSAAHRVVIVAALACAVAAVLVVKRRAPDAEPETVAPQLPAVAPNDAAAAGHGVEANETLPRLVDLGAGRCTPCKMMEPILAELREDYADTFVVEFIDVWENPDAGGKFGIRMIPTQIFYDAAGRELFRHEGFLGKKEILATWERHGVNVHTAKEK